MSDDAIQDLIGHMNVASLSMMWGPKTQGVIERAQAQHTANRDVIASLRSSLEGRAAEVAQLQAKIAQLESDIVVAALDTLGPKHEALLAIREELEAERDRSTELILRLSLEVAESKAQIARLESAIADHVIDEGLVVPDDLVAALSCDCDAPWCVKARAEHALFKRGGS